MDEPTEKSDDRRDPPTGDSLRDIDPLNTEIELQVSQDNDCDDGEEFTLETLSEAYACVVDEQEQGDPETIESACKDASFSSSEDQHADPDQGIDDDVACPVSPESIVESILFVGCPSDVKLTGKKIASVLRDVSPKEVGQIVKKLNARYQEQNAAWRIQAEKGVYRMVLRESLSEFQDVYFGRNREAKLNQSSIDVLAVVAYHQPATREDIDKVRGKSSGSVLNQLVKRNLLTIEKSNENPTRKLYRTTDRFLDLFGLHGIEDLPQSHEVADIEELAD